MNTFIVNHKHSKAQNFRDALRNDAESEFQNLPKSNVQFDGFTFRIKLSKDDDMMDAINALASKLTLNVEHLKYYDKDINDYFVDVASLQKWSQNKSYSKLHYCGTLKYKSGWARVYGLKNKYNSSLYISLGGVYQYSDEKVSLINRINRNTDKTILRIRLERSGIELYKYELAFDYSMDYNKFMTKYLHVFIDGTRNKTKIYKALGRKKSLLTTNDELKKGIVYLSASGNKYIYNKQLKNGLSFPLTRMEIRGQHKRDEDDYINKSYILKLKEMLLFENIASPSYKEKQYDLEHIPKEYQIAYIKGSKWIQY